MWTAMRYLVTTPFLLALLVGAIAGLANFGRARVPAILVFGVCAALFVDYVVLNLVWELGVQWVYETIGEMGIALLVAVGRVVPTLSMITLAVAAVWGRSRGEAS